MHVVYLINKTPTLVLDNLSPYDKSFHAAPIYTHLCVFDCLCYVSTHSNSRQKFESRANRCVFIGFKTGVKGYKVLNISI